MAPLASTDSLRIKVGETHERGSGVNSWIGGKMRSGYRALEIAEALTNMEALAERGDL